MSRSNEENRLKHKKKEDAKKRKIKNSVLDRKQQLKEITRKFNLDKESTGL